jgi:glycerate 2-kinase
MPSRVLIIPDKFKGTLTARQVATAIARGWKRHRPDDLLELVPMSDGGDGFGETISEILRARSQIIKTVDAAHRPCRTRWWWQSQSKMAIIESAKVIGLSQLPPGKFHPFALDTFGLGVALRAAERKGARHCLIGIGGSATNDGGFGLARALGWEFRDRNERPITLWTELKSLASIRPPGRKFSINEILVAVDVQNPLLGPTGATRIYGPQKGIRPRDYSVAESSLRHLATVVRRSFGHDFAREPGAGAAGGLGFGLKCFFGAKLQPGFELFAKCVDLARRLRDADLVITGEGAIDRSSLMGKGVGQLASLCRSLKIPCIGLAGCIKNPVLARRHFTQTAALTPDLTTEIKAKTNPAYWLMQRSATVAKEWLRPIN